MVIHGVAFLALIPSVLMTVYYFVLALVSFRPQPRRRESEWKASTTSHRYIILIPAHDEELTISKAISSSQSLDYPADRFQIVVVADNCTDSTATVARAAGAIVLERSDLSLRGKGHALQWAFGQIQAMQYDAVIIQDADCRLSPTALKQFDEHLAKGERVLQAAYVVSNPDESAISYAAAVGNLIENDFFYAPKSYLGLSVMLRGTGMVLHRTVLQKFPWNAHSIAEDTEYSIELARNRIPVRFLSDVVVYSDFPATKEQLQVQRVRWASGNLAFGKSQAWSLIWDGLRSRNWMLADAGWTLLAVSRPIVIISALLAILATGLADWIYPDPVEDAMLGVAEYGMMILAAYFVLGIVRLGFSVRRMGYLASTPWIIARLMGISVLGLFGYRKNDWVRTPRTTSDSSGSGDTKV